MRPETRVMTDLMRYTYRPIVLVHGGVGPTPNDRKRRKLEVVKTAAKLGYQVLTQLGTVVDAVVAAVSVMEEDSNFSAGIGSPLTLDGNVEMDACVMDGQRLNMGAVHGITNVKCPIKVARKVLDTQGHATIAGRAANEFAEAMKIQTFPAMALMSQTAKSSLKKFKDANKNFVGIGQEGVSIDSDSVGCVALDGKARLASGMSTGGITGKLSGRVSDAAVIGCGTYADNEVGAFSVSGFGEDIIKFCLAHRIIREIENGRKGQQAARFVVNKFRERFRSPLGIIGLSKFGEIVVDYNSQGFPWAYQQENILHFGCDNGEDDTEIIYAN